MATVIAPPDIRTVADLIEELGDIPPDRILLHPTPGTATERDAIALLEAPDKRLCELIDGVLVEKTMGVEESAIAILLAHYLCIYMDLHDLGKILGADAAMRPFPGRVRIPDVSFVSWERYPKPGVKLALPDLAPDLAVEILSESNTRKEMARKLADYRRCNVRLIWYVDPEARTVEVFAPEDGPPTVLGEHQSLDGGDVLPGFVLPIAAWLDEACRRGPR